MSEPFGKAFDDLPTKKKGPGSEFMKAWEQVKRDFGHADEDTGYELPLNINITKPDPEYFDEDERIVKLSTCVPFPDNWKITC